MGQIERGSRTEKRRLSPIERARQPLLQLPGMERFARVGMSEGEMNLGLNKAVMDMLKWMDATAMQKAIADSLALSEQEAMQLFGAEERKPYESKIRLSDDPKEREEQIVSVGKYLTTQLKEVRRLPKGPEKQKRLQEAEDMLRMWYEYSVTFLFEEESNRLRDLSYGIDPEDRKKGTINTEATKSKFREAALKVNPRSKYLYQKALVATEDGSLWAAENFLLYNAGDKQLREVLQMVLADAANNEDINVQRMELAFKVQALGMKMGLTQDMYLGLNGFPESRTLRARLHRYLQNKKLNADLVLHLSKDAGVKVTKDQTLNMYEIMGKCAQRAGMTGRAETTKQLERRKARMTYELERRQPQIMMAIDTNAQLNTAIPTRKGATDRGSFITYPDNTGRTQGWALGSARKRRNRAIADYGHEVQHLGHLLAVEGTKKRYWGRFARMPFPIIEEPAAVMQTDQLARLYPDRREKVARDTYYPDMLEHVMMRKCGLKGLVRDYIQGELEKLWIKGKGETPSRRQLKRVLKSAEVKAVKWSAEGVNIQYPHGFVAHTMLIGSFPLEGSAYVTDFILRQEQNDRHEGKPRISLKDAMIKEYGPVWMKDPVAMATWGLLMEKTRTKWDVTKLGGMVIGIATGMRKVSRQVEFARN